MFRTRHRPENAARPSAQRGSVGSARVWDERTRALRVAAGPAVRPGPEAATSPEELAALIRGIVAVTLDTRLTELERPRRAALASELEARLCALFGLARPAVLPPAEPAAPEPAPAPPTPFAELDAPASPARPAPDVPTPSAPLQPAPPAALRALQLVLEDRLERLGGPLAERADLRRLLARLALEQALSAAPPAQVDDETLRNLDVLERRAAKLERALHDARAALAYVSGLEHVDPGVASIYRQVQGLATDDPRREQKAGVLEKIFRANLALRERPGGTSGQS